MISVYNGNHFFTLNKVNFILNISMNFYFSNKCYIFKKQGLNIINLENKKNGGIDMFCYQCQEAKSGVGCDINGVCGKKGVTSDLQDILVYVTKGISNIIVKNNIVLDENDTINKDVVNSLFITITNANFDDAAIIEKIKYMISKRDRLREKYKRDDYHDSATFTFDENNVEKIMEKAKVLDSENEDILSLRGMIIYGIKGIAAYVVHADNLGFKNNEIYKFVYKGLNAVIEDSLTKEEVLDVVIETGKNGVEAMALLDLANTSTYGKPEISIVETKTFGKPGILISGHDLHDIKQLLEQTKGTGIDVYTHCEMLPAHYYPELKKYDNLVGNYGGAWHEQISEFKTFNGPILFTTNCIVPPRDPEVLNRIFTTGTTGFPGCTHIKEDEKGNKDFREIIDMAKKSKPPVEIENVEIVGGFAHDQVTLLLDKVVDAVKNGDIKKFVVMAGCDGRFKDREYYTQFAKSLPKDTVILTAGCAKYRYNKLNLGDINGIPRVLDAGQCNDSYSLVVIAMKLKEAFGLLNINELPIVYNIAWYEQKAIIVLLALLSLGVENIHIGPTMPAFLSENVAKILVDNFNLGGINTPEEDVIAFLK